jgi:hypothetical protein
MFEFHYGYILPKYGDAAKVLLSDTDSLAYHIYTEDIFHDIKEDIIAKFDTSNFPEGQLIHYDRNENEVGFMKIETADKQIEEFIGLRSRL